MVNKLRLIGARVQVMETMARKHRTEEELARQEAERKLTFQREAADEKYSQL